MADSQSLPRVPPIPSWKSQWWVSDEVPPDQRVLQVVVSMHRRALDNTPVRPSVEYCYCLARVLTVFGFGATVVPARVLVTSTADRGNEPVATVGTDKEGGYGTAASGDLHTIVWASDFRRFVDVGLFLRSEFGHTYRSNPEISWPMVFGPVSGSVPDTEFAAVGTRAPYTLRYVIAPHRRIDLHEMGLKKTTMEDLERTVVGVSWQTTSAILAVRNFSATEIPRGSGVFDKILRPAGSD